MLFHVATTKSNDTHFVRESSLVGRAGTAARSSVAPLTAELQGTPPIPQTDVVFRSGYIKTGPELQPVPLQHLWQALWNAWNAFPIQLGPAKDGT